MPLLPVGHMQLMVAFTSSPRWPGYGSWRNCGLIAGTCSAARSAWSVPQSSLVGRVDPQRNVTVYPVTIICTATTTSRMVTQRSNAFADSRSITRFAAQVPATIAADRAAANGQKPGANTSICP